MMPSEQVLLIRYGEIGLKKGNRAFFEKQLCVNLRFCLKMFENVNILRQRGRIFIRLDGDIEHAARTVSRVFGVVGVRVATQMTSDWDVMQSNVRAVIEKHPLRSQHKRFRIRTSRSDKTFFLNSQQMDRELGGCVLNLAPSWTVDLTEPEVELTLEVHASYSYLATKEIAGVGGLPVGSAGRLGLLLSGGIDSTVAGVLMQKRGALLTAMYFHSFPYTSEHAFQKVKDLAMIVSRHQRRVKLFKVHFTHIQEAVKKHCASRYSVILGRRMMMRIAEKICDQEKLLGVVTGESLGQVASQTLENMHAVGSSTALQVYRPLLSYDKVDIVNLAKSFGSFDISIRPHEDCCALFVDKHPVTKADMASIMSQEEKLDISGLVEEALAKTECMFLSSCHEETRI